MDKILYFTFGLIWRIILVQKEVSAWVSMNSWIG